MSNMVQTIQQTITYTETEDKNAGQYKYKDILATIGCVSYLLYVSMRHYVLTTSGDIVVCFHTAVCLSC